MPDIKEIIGLLKNPAEADTKLIKKAYDFADHAHRDHKRNTGEPYFNHLFETARTLAEIGMGAVTISAGLLHDTIEDVEIKPEEIEKEFGAEILFLVEGVTKLGKIRYRGTNRHNESLRKFFVAMSQDLRVLIIKLADRLHNMKTLKYVPVEKQSRIAKETLEIYAPIAYRLGIRKLHRELEDLAFGYVYPKEYQEISSIMKERKRQDQEHLEKFQRSISKALAKVGITKFTTEHRIKGLYSLYKKYLRKDRDVDKIYDVAAIRIIVPTTEDCYKVLGIIHSTWRPLPGRIKDYIAFPKPNGYRSLHTTVFTGDGGIVELQIKSESMHREAEYGIASHLSYKTGSKETANSNLMWINRLLPFRNFINNRLGNQTTREVNLEDVPKWVKELVDFERQMPDQDKFIKDIKDDFFQHRIFVFTPQGDVVDLPIDSSTVDFAYAIHSDIGNHVSGVKVNGKLVSLETKLQNGDIVEVITKGANHPSSKWLDFAKTATAQKHIRSYLTDGTKTHSSKNSK